MNSSGVEIASGQTYLSFVFNHQADSIKLEQLYDADFTDYISESTSINVDAMSDSLFFLKHAIEINNCVTCVKKSVQIMDSIDINKDGFKELVIFREWDCRAPYYHSIPHNGHFQVQIYGQYEVWDVKTKRRIFEIKSIFESSIPVTVNVMKTIGYSSEVIIDDRGSVYITTPISEFEFEIDIKNGTYHYNNETGNYEKE